MTTLLLTKHDMIVPVITTWGLAVWRLSKSHTGLIIPPKDRRVETAKLSVQIQKENLHEVGLIGLSISIRYLTVILCLG